MTVDTALRAAAIVAVVFLLSGIAAALIIRKVVVKLTTLVVFAGLALVMWSQRANIDDCADRATLGPATCRFLWFDVDVPSPADQLPGR